MHPSSNIYKILIYFCFVLIFINFTFGEILIYANNILYILSNFVCKKFSGLCFCYQIYTIKVYFYVVNAGDNSLHCSKIIISVK